MIITHKQFKCTSAGCGSTLGFRAGDTLIVNGIEVEFKRPHKLLCPYCRRHTTFNVDRPIKPIDKKIETVKL